MPMPHRTQLQLIKRRLIGKEGSERVRELRASFDAYGRQAVAPKAAPKAKDFKTPKVWGEPEN